MLSITVLRICQVIFTLDIANKGVIQALLDDETPKGRLKRAFGQDYMP